MWLSEISTKQSTPGDVSLMSARRHADTRTHTYIWKCMSILSNNILNFLAEISQLGSCEYCLRWGRSCFPNTVARLIKNCIVIYGNCGFSTVSTKAQSRSLSCTRRLKPAQSLTTFPLRFIYLILLSNLCLHSRVFTEISYSFLISNCVVHVAPVSSSIPWSA